MLTDKELDAIAKETTPNRKKWTLAYKGWGVTYIPNQKEGRYYWAGCTFYAQTLEDILEWIDKTGPLTDTTISCIPPNY